MEKIKRVTIEVAKSIIDSFGYKDYEISSVGRNNWVFVVENKCISLPKDSSKINYKIRSAAMKLLEKNMIPTTSLLDYGVNKGVEYIITQLLDAENIRLNKFTLKEQNEIHYKCGQLASSIHKISSDGYGRLDSNMKGSFESWKDFVEDYFFSALCRLNKDRELHCIFSNSLTQCFKNNAKLITANITPRLLHGDFHIGNILFKEKNIRALIDLDIVMSGDPHWDLGHYVRTFHGDRSFGSDHFFKGYGEFSIERANFYAMIIWTRKIASQAENRREALNESVCELKKILECFT